jgi:hypothetical protein
MVIQPYNKEDKSMDREELEKKYGKVWNTKQVSEDFLVESFMSPYVQVVKKSIAKRGLLTFQHDPRYYFDFTPI